MKRPEVFFLILLILISCGRTYKITTASMSNTFNVGQVVEAKEKALIERGDIVLFRRSQDSGQETWISRVMAISGDTIEIKDGDVIINGNLIELPLSASLQYIINTSDPLDLKNFRSNSVQQISANRYIGFLTKDEFAKVAKWKNIKDINRVINSPGEFTKGIVKYKSTDSWNPDHFGPLYVPSPQEKIKINKANISLFNYLIPDLLPDSTVTVKEKLYFLMGDNRSNAFDSRFIGLVPESRIIGTVDEDQ